MQSINIRSAGYAAILSIPAFNLIVGMFVGIKMLGKFRSAGDLVIGLVLACGWLMVAVLQIASSKNYSMHGWAVPAAGVMFVYSFYFYRWFLSVTEVAIRDEVKVTREKLYSDHPQLFTNPGFLGGYGCYVFDQKSGHLAIIKTSGYEIIRVEDIINADQKWIEKTRKGNLSNIDNQIVLTVRDIQTPIRTLSFGGKGSADKAFAQISLLRNSM